MSAINNQSNGELSGDKKVVMKKVPGTFGKNQSPVKYPKHHPQNKDKWKYANSSYKKQDDRALLKGYACLDCEDYYKSQNLTKDQVEQLMQKCSKHRSTVPPPINSPKGICKS